MTSAPSEEDDLAEVELGDLGKMNSQEVSTVQRLLRRLGYLKDDNMTRAMDGPTVTAIVAHLKDVKISSKDLTSEKCPAFPVYHGMDQGGLGNRQRRWPGPCG